MAEIPTSRNSAVKSPLSSVLDGRVVEKSRENRSSGSHQRPRGEGRHGCHEVLARVSGRPPCGFWDGNASAHNTHARITASSWDTFDQATAGPSVPLLS